MQAVFLIYLRTDKWVFCILSSIFYILDQGQPLLQATVKCNYNNKKPDHL